MKGKDYNTHFSCSASRSFLRSSSCRSRLSRSIRETRSRSSYSSRRLRMLVICRSYSRRRSADIICISRSCRESSIWRSLPLSCKNESNGTEGRMDYWRNYGCTQTMCTTCRQCTTGGTKEMFITRYLSATFYELFVAVVVVVLVVGCFLFVCNSFVIQE